MTGERYRDYSLVKDEGLRNFLTAIGKKKYAVQGRIGEGGFGKILLALNNQNDEYALKVIHAGEIEQKDNHLMTSLIKNEVKMHRKLSKLANNAHVTTLVENYKLDYQNDRFQVIVMEKMQCDLYDFMVVNKASMNNIQSIFRSICSSLAFCHANKVAHLDVKMENFLVNYNIDDHKYSDFPSISSIKLCDFGCSFNYKKNNQFCYQQFGTNEYKSPEAKRLTHQKEKYNQPVEQSLNFESMDVWSCGVILYVMITRTYPFLYDDNNKLHSNFSKRLLKQFTPNVEVYNLLKSIFRINPKKRPSFNEILEHPFLNAKK